MDTDSSSKNYSQETFKSSFPNFLPNRRHLRNNFLVIFCQNVPFFIHVFLRPMDTDSSSKNYSQETFKSFFPNFLSNRRHLRNKLLVIFCQNFPFFIRIFLRPMDTDSSSKNYSQETFKSLFPIFFQIEDTWGIISSSIFRQNVPFFIPVSRFFKANRYRFIFKKLFIRNFQIHFFQFSSKSKTFEE